MYKIRSIPHMALCGAKTKNCLNIREKAKFKILILQQIPNIPSSQT